MSQKHSAILTISIALVLGVVGDLTLRTGPWGLNFTIFCLLLSASLVVIRRGSKSFRASVSTAFCISAFSLLFISRDSVELQILDGLVILTLLGLNNIRALEIPLRSSGVIHHVIGLLRLGLCFAFGPFLLLSRATADVPTGWRRNTVGILRGFLFAAPVLFIFIGLFSAADANFEQLIDAITSPPNFERVANHVFFFLLIGWLSAGAVMSALTWPSQASNQLKDSSDSSAISILSTSFSKLRSELDWTRLDNNFLPRALTLGTTEISVFLGALSLLFAVFTILQLPYLFGGFAFVQSAPDLKLSEYARRGFIELSVAGALTLPVLLKSHWLLRSDDERAKKLYRYLTCILLILLGVIIASAIQRLVLLTGNLGYGMTTQRFYPFVFIIWLSVVFIWFAATVLRGARHQFASGAFAAMLVIIASLHFVNPDAFIANRNLNLFREGRDFDLAYNSKLSSDSVPIQIEALSALPADQKCVLEDSLHKRLADLEENSELLTFNFSRTSAITLLKSRLSQESACPTSEKIP